MNVVRSSLLSLLVLSLSAAAQTTGSTGGNAPIPLGQPSLGLSHVLATGGTYPSQTAEQGSLGLLHTFAFGFVPNNAARAEGQLLPVSSNTALFSLLGTDFGGNGTTNFGLPDLRERFLVANGAAPGTGLTVSNGDSFGSASLSMSSSLPMHTHVMADGVRTTGVSGPGLPFDVVAPSLGMHAFIITEGMFPAPGSGVNHPFIGEIRWYAGRFAPASAVPCDGRLLPISEYEALYTLLGVTFGGDGVSSFAVPDLRGRVAVGTGTGQGLSPVALGQTWGSPSVNLTVAQLPMHTHPVADESPTSPTGSSQPVPMAQPSLGITWLIAVQGLFPSHGSGGGAFDDQVPVLGELVGFAGNFAPGGFVQAHGQILSIAQNQALFALLGTTFGGNGSTSFALPDLRGRTPVGAAGFSSISMGQRMGVATRSLPLGEMTGHLHTYALPVVDAGLPEDGGVEDAGVEVDAGVEIDAGVAEDAGVEVDAGVAEDAGVEVDAGVAEDAGVEVDAGVAEDAGVELDAGIVVDAGVAEDAGVEVDAGVTEDAGIIADAGTQPSDAGLTPDAGDAPPTEPGGCGCATGADSSVLFGLLALLATRARRRRER